MSFSRFGRLGVHEFATSYRSRFLQLLQLPAMVALIIGIVGGSDLTDRSIAAQNTGQKLIKAALIIFVVIYICLFLLVAKSTSEKERLPPGEKRVLLALIFALPFLGVRLLFSILEYFSTISTFSPIGGNVLVRAFMANLEEILIVMGYTLAGILVPVCCDATRSNTEIEALRGERQENRAAPRALRASR